MRLALTRPLTFVTEAALDKLPSGSALYVWRDVLGSQRGAQLSARGVRLRSIEALLPADVRAQRP